jgi:hypothetical protein
MVKVKQSHYEPKRCRGGRRHSSYSFTALALDRVSGQRQALAALYPWGKDPRYPLDRVVEAYFMIPFMWRNKKILAGIAGSLAEIQTGNL